MQDTPDTLSGNELDDSGYDESPEISPKTSGEASPQPLQPARRKRRRFLWLGGLLAVVLMAAVGGYFLTRAVSQKPSTSSVIADSVREKPVHLAAFIIPFTEGGTFSYIHIGVSFGVDGDDIRQELNRKKNILRGKIYDQLRAETVQNDRIPSLEYLKKKILNVVRDTMGQGETDKIYITHFLIV